MRNRLISLNQLQALLEYDTESGKFFWRVDRRPRTKAGDEAGYLQPSGFRVIVIEGKPYMAHRLAWFYETGEWPRGEPTFENGDKGDLTWGNFEFNDTPVSFGAAAAYMRSYRARKRAGLRKEPQRTDSPYPQIRWRDTSEGFGQWIVNHPTNPRVGWGNGYADFGLAVRAMYDRRAAIAYVEAHPPAPPEPGDETRFGPSHKFNFTQAQHYLCYNPDTGYIYWRTHDRPKKPEPHAGPTDAHDFYCGLRAEKEPYFYNTESPKITFMGADCLASAMAIFLSTGEWPKPKSIEHLNGDVADNRWDNLSFTLPSDPT